MRPTHHHGNLNRYGRKTAKMAAKSSQMPLGAPKDMTEDSFADAVKATFRTSRRPGAKPFLSTQFPPEDFSVNAVLGEPGTGMSYINQIKPFKP